MQYFLRGLSSGSRAQAKLGQQSLSTSHSTGSSFSSTHTGAAPTAGARCSAGGIGSSFTVCWPPAHAREPTHVTAMSKPLSPLVMKASVTGSATHSTQKSRPLRRLLSRVTTRAADLPPSILVLGIGCRHGAHRLGARAAHKAAGMGSPGRSAQFRLRRVRQRGSLPSRPVTKEPDLATHL